MNRRAIILIGVVGCVIMIIAVIFLAIIQKPSIPQLNAQLTDSGSIRYPQSNSRGLMYTKSNNIYLVKDGRTQLVNALPSFDSLQISPDGRFGATKNNSTFYIYSLDDAKLITQFDANSFGWIDSNTYLVGVFATKPEFATDADNIPEKLFVKDLSGKVLNSYDIPYSVVGLMLSNTDSLYLSTLGDQDLLNLNIYQLNRHTGTKQLIKQLPNFGFNRYNQFGAALIQTGQSSGPVQSLTSSGLNNKSLYQPLSDVSMVSINTIIYILTDNKSMRLYKQNEGNNKTQLLANIDLPSNTVVGGTYVVDKTMYITNQNQVIVVDLSDIQKELQ